MMPTMGPPLPGTMRVVLAPEMRSLVGGYKAAKTSNDEISRWCHAGEKRGGLSLYQFCIIFFLFSRRAQYCV